MFFPRLRRQAKWVFILLVVVFGAGFVFLGVGSGGLDLGTLIQNLNVGGSSKPSLGKAQDEVQKNPSSAAAYRHLAKALEARGRTAEAITALQRVTVLAPKDTASLRELAGLQRSQVSNLAQRALDAQSAYSAAQSGSQTFGPSSGSNLGQALSQDPIASSVTSAASTRYSDALASYQGAVGAVVDTYKKLAAAAPRDASQAYALAQVADGYRDYQTAITAYKRFLVLAPGSSDAPGVKSRLKQLERTQKASTAGG
jgi:tetratricopeptide (TPR) repeat protein